MIFILLGALFASLFWVRQSKTAVVSCTSFGCSYNKGGHCGKPKIIIYDNTIIGLCLYHSESMEKRILEPLNKGAVVERGKPNPKMINKIMRTQEKSRDSELIKNPKAFARWMRRLGA